MDADQKIYYRFSTQPYEPGQVMTHGNFVQDKNSSPHAWVEQALERMRPEGAPRRNAAVYLTRTANEARCFGESEYKTSGYVYEVCAGEVWWAVMCLPDMLRKCGEDSQHVDAIAAEYWRQASTWKFLEGLALEVKVLSVVEPLPADEWNLFRSGVMHAYGEDRERALALCR